MYKEKFKSINTLQENVKTKIPIFFNPSKNDDPTQKETVNKCKKDSNPKEQEGKIG